MLANRTSERRRNASAVPLPWWTSQSRMNTRCGAKLADRELGRDRDVVEQTEAHRAIRFGMMPGGSHPAETEPRLASHQCPSHLAGAAGGVQRRAVRGLPDERVRVDRAATGQRQLLDLLDVACAVDQLQLGLRRRRRLRAAPSPASLSTASARSIATRRSGVSGCSGMYTRGSCSRQAGWLK